jgi:hypothetical protein
MIWHLGRGLLAFLALPVLIHLLVAVRRHDESFVAALSPAVALAAHRHANVSAIHCCSRFAWILSAAVVAPPAVACYG